MLITDFIRVLGNARFHCAEEHLLKQALNNLFVGLWKERWPIADQFEL
jgi:hypothetical protein